MGIGFMLVGTGVLYFVQVLREEIVMTNVKNISDQLMGLSISELNEVAKLVQDIKIFKAKAGITVGDRVYVVQKTKKTS